MASTKISAMSATTTPSQVALVPIVENGANFSTEKQYIKLLETSPFTASTTNASYTIDVSLSADTYYIDFTNGSAAGQPNITLNFSNVRNGKVFYAFLKAPNWSSWTETRINAGTNGSWSQYSIATENTTFLCHFICNNGKVFLVSVYNVVSYV